MTTIPKNRTELALWLGIAKSAVSAQAQRGMPTSILEAAQAWRREHINPARKKGTRFDPSKLPPSQQNPAEAVKRAAALLNQVVAQVGQSIADHLERLPDEIEHACAALGPEHMAVIRQKIGKAQHLAKTATLSDHENTDPTENPTDPESAIP